MCANVLLVGFVFDSPLTCMYVCACICVRVCWVGQEMMKEQQEKLRQEYEGKLADLERERETIEEEKAQVRIVHCWP